MATENETETTEPTSSRDVVEAAFDAYEKAGPDSGLITLEKVEPGAEPDPAEADKAALGGNKDRAVEVPEGEGADRPRDPHTGQFTKGGKQPAKAPVVRAKGGPAEPATPQEQPGAVPPPTPAAPASSRTLRAPQSWRPGAREGFDKLPAPVREEIWRLDAEREKVVREAAPYRKAAEDWQRVIAPYEQAIRASGGEPMTAVSNVMRTVYALGTQPEMTRAGIIHNLMRMYGVSVESLASAIDGAGGGPGAPAPAPGPQVVYDPRFDQFYQQYQQDRQVEAQRANQAADAELEEFAKNHEFLDDVLPDMVDFMEVASRRGVALDYDSVYSRALSLRPDLLEIIQQREAAASPDGPTQRSILAASGVKASPSRRPAPGDKKFSDSREAVAAAYDAHAGDSGRV